MNNETFSCRIAAKADLPDILRLFAQPEMDDGEVLDVEQAERIFERMAAYPDYTLFVAVRDADVVGAYALLIMDNLGHMGAPSAVVEDVVIDPACQGLGVGKSMMAHARDIAGHKNCYKLVLSSNAKRERAHAFYQSLGFEQHGYSFRTDAPSSRVWGTN